MTISYDETRTVPYDHDAEAAVLGALLIDDEAVHRTRPVIRPEDFHRARHQYIYAAMLSESGRGGVIDQITVARELAQRDRLDAVGGLPYLGQRLPPLPPRLLPPGRRSETGEGGAKR